MIHRITHIAIATIALFIAACDKAENDHDHEAAGSKQTSHAEPGHEHEHEEVPLGTFDIGGMKVEAAQGHGDVAPGKESHLVIKLPYSDKGSTVVRAWIGGPDRTLSTVAKGEYAPAHDDYDVHVVAPDPLPADAQWWVEIVKPDGTKAVGSFPFAPVTNSDTTGGDPR